MKNLVCIIFLTNYLFAWGNTGHRIVGKIAEERLSNKAKRQIKNIIIFEFSFLLHAQQIQFLF